MATLYFKVASDWEEVVRLRNEIAKLKSELRGMDSTQSPAAFKALNRQLSASTQRMDELVANAAKAGAEMEGGFKKKIFEASQTVNGFTEKIIAQRNVVKGVEADVKRLGESYRIALKRDPFSANSKLDEYTSAKRVLNEEKAALFGLTQQQAEARLSVKKLRDEYALYKRDAGDAKAANEGMSLSLGKVLGVVGGVTALKEFGSQIVRVRGEFQEMQTAIETMVGKDMADTIMPRIKELAKISPLTMKDMVGAEKMMLGFNIQAEDTIKYLKAMSDISMGSSTKFNSLVLAFSQMSAAGKLMGQDLNQMINAGFNPLQIISERTGKSIAILKDEMSKGAVSAEMVQQAFIDATSAGGKFYQMSENASKTINGQLSMMQDALDTAFNEMGQASEGVILSGVKTATTLIKNYETVGKVLVGLIATYGTYRTAVMLSTLAASKHTIAEIALTNARVLARKAQMALNASMLTNPYVALATVVAGLVATMIAYSSATTSAEKAQKKLDESIAEAEKSSLSEESQLARLKGRLSALTQGTDEYNKVKDEIVGKFGKYYSGLDEEISKVGLTEQAYRKLTDAIRQSFGARQYGKFASEQQSSLESTMSENLEKIQDRLYKELGDENGERIYEQIRQGIIKKQFGLGKGFNNITGLSNDLSIALDKVAGKEGGLLDVTNRSVETYISNILRAQKLAEEMDSKARARFGIQGENAGKKNETEESTTYADDFKAARKEWEDAKKELSKIEKDKDKFTSKQYEDAKKREESTEKRFKDLGGLTGSALSKQEKESDKQRKQQEKLNDDLLSLRRQNQQEEIDLMKEGTEKKIAQINLDYDKEIDAILKKEKEWKDAQGGKLTSEQSAEIRTSFVNAYVKREKSTSDVNKEQLEEEKRAMNEYLKEYGSYMERRQAITELYDEKISKSTTEGERLSLAEEMKKELAAVDDEARKKTSIITKLFSDMSNRTVDEIRSISREAQSMLDYLNGGEFKTDADGNGLFGLTREQFEILSESPEKLQSIKDEIANIDKEADQMDTSFNKVASGLEKVFSAGNDTKKLREGLEEVEDGLGDIMRTTQFLSNTFSKLGDSFGGIAEGFNVAMDTVNSAMSGAKAASALGLGRIGTYAGAAVGAVTSLVGAIAKIHDKKNERRIQRLQEQIDTLDRSYEKLEKSIEEAYSKDASRLIEQNNKMLEQQKLLIQQQIREEEDKKKTDDDRIKEYRDQIDAINDLIEENKEKAKDAIFGEDLKSAIENFADAYAEAWASGEDRAESAKDTVRKMMQQMVTTSIKSAIQSSAAMERIRDKLQAFYTDNVLTGWEQDYIYNMAEELQKDLDKQFGWADSLMKDESSGKYEQSATSGGFEAMSQDSADELNGRFTALQMAGEEIKSQNMELLQSVNIISAKLDTVIATNGGISKSAVDDLLRIQADSYLELVEIRENTGAIVKPIQQMQKDIAEVKQNTSRL